MNIQTIINFFSKHIFKILIFTYFIVTAGIIFDMILEPPSIGTKINEKGQIVEEFIAKGHENYQYVIEGILASVFFISISVGMILVDKGIQLSNADNKKILYLIGGPILTTFALIFICYFIFVKFH